MCVCVGRLSVGKLCVGKLCVSKLCVREMAGGRREEGRRAEVHNQKQEPHRCGEKLTEEGLNVQLNEVIAITQQRVSSTTEASRKSLLHATDIVQHSRQHAAGSCADTTRHKSQSHAHHFDTNGHGSLEEQK